MVPYCFVTSEKGKLRQQVYEIMITFDKRIVHVPNANESIIIVFKKM